MRKTEVIEDIFEKALDRGVTILMNKLNILEVYYNAYRAYGEQTADDLFESMGEFPIQIQSKITNDVF